MPDEFDLPLDPDIQVEDDIQDEVQPPAPPAPSGPSDLERYLLAQEANSRLIAQQIAASRSQAPTTPEPAIDPQLLTGAAPVIKAVLRDQLGAIDELKNTVTNLQRERVLEREGAFIRSQVPEFDKNMGAIAAHIHQQLDAFGVPPGPEARQQYFTPIAVVSAAQALGLNRPAAPPPSQTGQARIALEGRGGVGTAPTAPNQPTDYLSMTDAEFAKSEAKIAQARMNRNRG